MPQTFVSKLDHKEVTFTKLHRFFYNTTELSDRDMRRKKIISRLLCSRYTGLIKRPWIVALDKTFKRSKEAIKFELTPLADEILAAAKDELGDGFSQIIKEKSGNAWKRYMQKIAKFEVGINKLVEQATIQEKLLMDKISNTLNLPKPQSRSLYSLQVQSSRYLVTETVNQTEKIFTQDVNVLTEDLSSSFASFSSQQTGIVATSTQIHPMNLTLLLP